MTLTIRADIPESNYGANVQVRVPMPRAAVAVATEIVGGLVPVVAGTGAGAGGKGGGGGAGGPGGVGATGQVGVLGASLGVVVLKEVLV
jgi:hypothetical protein